jgi:TolA-binding protein
VIRKGDIGAKIEKSLRAAEMAGELIEKHGRMEIERSLKSLEMLESFDLEKALKPLEKLDKLGRFDLELGRFGKFGPGPMGLEEEQAQESPDSLWAAGRAALNRGGFTQAATTFNTLWRRYPRSTYAGDALYWEAFARKRMGSTTNLRTALDRLTRQERDYKDASTRSQAAVLATEIRGELAQRGDAREAERIAEMAGALGTPPAAAAAPVAPGVAAPPAAAPAPRAAPVAVQAPRASTGVSPSSVRAGRRNSQVPGCPSEDDDERVAALNALQQMDSELAMPILAKVLAKREKCSETLRRKAVFLVSQQKSTESADLLLQAAKTDPDREVKQNAVFWLGQVRDERAVVILGVRIAGARDFRPLAAPQRKRRCRPAGVRAAGVGAHRPPREGHLLLVAAALDRERALPPGALRETPG